MSARNRKELFRVEQGASIEDGTQYVDADGCKFVALRVKAGTRYVGGGCLADHSGVYEATIYNGDHIVHNVPDTGQWYHLTCVDVVGGDAG